MTEQNDLSQPDKCKTKKRPDGSDMARYKNLKNWTYRRWAWEFLRRNTDFIDACKGVATTGNDDEKQSIATTYGLKKFKRYNEAYGGGSGKPIFSIGAITIHSNLDPDAQKKATTRLLTGQVLIKFDLKSALADTTILDKQIRSAGIALKKRLSKYSKSSDPNPKRVPHKVGLFGQYLRLLDSRATNILQIDSGLLIAPHKVKKINNDLTSRTELAPTISRKMKRAVLYSTTLYRSLAAQKGRPKVSSIPLEE